MQSALLFCISNVLKQTFIYWFLIFLLLHPYLVTYCLWKHCPISKLEPFTAFNNFIHAIQGLFSTKVKHFSFVKKKVQQYKVCGKESVPGIIHRFQFTIERIPSALRRLRFTHTLRWWANARSKVFGFNSMKTISSVSNQSDNKNPSITVFPFKENHHTDFWDLYISQRKILNLNC